jgi:hypothetical protein
VPAPDLRTDARYWTLITSEDFRGTSLKEMQQEWTLAELLDALDVLQYNRAVSAACARAAREE